MRTFFLAIFKWVVFCVFLIVLAGFSGVAAIRYIFATSQVAIPDLTGQEIKYAADLLAQQHLKLRIITEQLDPQIPKDHILAQDPKPGSFTKKNQTIRVVVSQGIESSSIPDLIGKPWQDALRMLRGKKIRVGNVAHAHSAEVPVDSIVAQTPLANTTLPLGTPVDLLVSRGPYGIVIVMPDVVEQQLFYAQQTLEKLGLVLGKIEHEEYAGVPENTILSQIPKPGSLVKERDIVTLVASSGGNAGETIPGSMAAPQYTSLEYIAPPGRFDQEIAMVVKNDEGIAEIYRQIVPAGDRILVQVPVVGPTVVEIYLDGVLNEVKPIQE